MQIANQVFTSRLLLGTGKFASRQWMQQAIAASGCDWVTLALKRIDRAHPEDDVLGPLQALGVNLLPNTSGARTAQEAILAAELAYAATGTRWLKLEIHPDSSHLLPDGLATLEAAKVLVQRGFTVLPYCPADPLLCRQLEDAGCAAVMPLGAPIGSNQGLQQKAMLSLIIERAGVPVIVDAGLGAPSHAAEAMELGADAVLVNTAIATAANPVAMAQAFAMAVKAGRMAYEAGLAQSGRAQASSPLTEFFLGAQ